MGMDVDLEVAGIIDASGLEWDHHKAIWDSCNALDIDVPKETRDYFFGGEPSDLGIEMPLGREALKHIPLKQSEDNSRYTDLQTPGYLVVDLRKVPAKVRKLAFWIKVSV